MRSLTVGQRKKPSQHFVRKGRLTARNFGSEINAKKVTPSFIKRLLGKYEFSRVKAVAWESKMRLNSLKYLLQKKTP